jgi:hypothetical protein
MGSYRSIRFFSRARTTSQRGFVLITAIVLAVLYFALMELLLLDSSRQLQEAQRFRARVVAMHLAESGAELSANQIFTSAMKDIGVVEDWQGKKTGRMFRNEESGAFQMEATGTTTGVVHVSSTVTVKGNAKNGNLRIDFTEHTQ